MRTANFVIPLRKICSVFRFFVIRIAFTTKNSTNRFVMLFLLAVNCGRLSAPVNGTVFGEQTTFPNILQFSCDEGFTQHGATERRCQSNGTWSGNETSCEGTLHLPY